MKSKYDIAIIGGGSAGLFGAVVANTLGAKTCLIERDKLGGECTWTGCIPSKSLIKSAGAADTFSNLGKYGLGVSEGLKVDTRKVMEHVREIINKVARGEEPGHFEKQGIAVLKGSPSFIDKKTVVVDDKEIEAVNYIIATGSRPFIPPVEGLDKINYLTNATIFDMLELPESMIVLGGGPIGIEMAQSMQRLGVEVTVLQRGPRILPKDDPEVIAPLVERLKREGVKILTGHQAVKFEESGGVIKATVKDKEGTSRQLSSASVLVATGRLPNTEGMKLDAAGVEYGKNGIKVNAYLQTTNPSIFAAGDVTGPYRFTHVASYHASVCVRNALFRRLAWSRVDYSNIAWATFTNPEIAHLGLTEDEAKKQIKKIKVYRSEYSASDRAKTDLEEDGLLKIITDGKGRIVGAHICGAEAGEIIQGLLVAKSHGIPLEKLAGIMYIYPTLSETIKKIAGKALREKMDKKSVKLLLKIMKRH